MKVTVERTPESEAVLNVEIDWSELEKASDRAYRKLAQKYNVPGFRKGHAPRSMLERMLGKEAIYQEGLEDLMDESYRNAVRENDLRPIGQPTLDAPPIELGQNYTFTARVPILTPATLGDYTSVRVERPVVTVTDEEVQQVLERLQQDQAMWLPVERPAEYDDKVTVDLRLTVGEREVSNLHDNEFELTRERNGIFTGMDEHVVGMTEGQSKEFTTTIPEDYANPELAGKEAQYSVTLKGVKHRELPELDDELAKSVGDFASIDEVRQAIREQLRSQKSNEASRELRENAVKAVVDSSEVEVHPVLVSDEVDSMMREMEQMLGQSRISLPQFLEMSQKSEDEYRAELEPEARERVKRDLVLSAVANAEGLYVSDAEVEGYLQALSAMGGKVPTFRQLSANQRASLETRLAREKAQARILDIATEGNPEPIIEGAETETAESTEVNAREAAAVAREIETPAEVRTGASVDSPMEAVVTPAAVETDASVETAADDEPEPANAEQARAEETQTPPAGK